MRYRNIVATFAGIVLAAYGLCGQDASAPNATSNDDYAIGSGDVLNITIGDAPELSGKYRVADDGLVTIPGLKKPLQAGDETASQLSSAIAKALVADDILRDPKVHVYVEEFHGRSITVLGAVNKPSVYPLLKATTLVEALSMAGGLAPAAGGTITVLRRQSNSQGAASSDSSLVQRFTIDIGKLMRGSNPSLNLQVRSGDTITVTSAPLIYVVGAVNRPGAFPVQNSSGEVTVLEALALAQGPTPTAAVKRSFIVRRSEDSDNSTEVPVNISKVLGTPPADTRLQDNDILFIPDSAMKRSIRALSQFAVQAASGIAIYGIGYRLGNVSHP